MKTLNINDYVYVRLTQRGRDILRANHDMLPTISEYVPPVEDSQGWSKWQLWVLMQELGIHVKLGFETPFEPLIRVAYK